MEVRQPGQDLFHDDPELDAGEIRSEATVETEPEGLMLVRPPVQLDLVGPIERGRVVVRRRKRLAWLGWTTASLAAVVIMSGSVVYYYVTKV